MTIASRIRAVPGPFFRVRTVPPADPFELPTQEEAQAAVPQPEDDGEPYPHDPIVFGNGWNMS